MHLTTLICAVLASGASALPSPHAGHVVHEKRAATPYAWTKGERLAPTDLLPVRIGLTQSNLDKGHDMLMAVSHPDSPSYGKHYTAEEVHDLFAPAKAAVNTVSSWLEAAGIHASRISQSTNKQWIQFDALAEEMENLLKTKFHLYEHEPTGKQNVACEEYHVPEHVTEHVDYITPGIKLFAASGNRKADGGLEKRKTHSYKHKPLLKALEMDLASLLDPLLLPVTCSSAITPACIKTLYNITVGSKAAAGNQLGIFEDLNDKYSQTDLNSFWTFFYPTIPYGTGPTNDNIDGATTNVNVAQAGPESDLDLQISWPIIYPQKINLFQTDDNVYEANYTYPGFLNNFLDAIDGSYCTFEGGNSNDPLSADPPYPDPAAGGYKGQLQCGVYKPTNVISISYGGQEADLPQAYQKRQCQEYMKLGMQGISIVISSGDSGVSGPAGDACLGPGGYYSPTGKIFSPDFPATCPYITAAGATYLPTGADVRKDQEVAVTRFPSGGGFSNIYPIPSYQSSAVQTYLTKHTPPYAAYSTTNNQSVGIPSGIYNKAGRGYPDISAVGDNVVIVNMGAPTLIGGTSASAPVFAAILTRINEERIAAGKSTVGFVNPVLYANPNAFHDITTGSNPGCGTNGFSVSQGWDPVTGLGTPNYPALLSVFMAQK